MMPEYNNFVGRKAELDMFQGILDSPHGQNHIVFLWGDGGIGKTRLLRRMLSKANECGVGAAKELIDLFSTDYRHIDGIQGKINEVIKHHTSSLGEPDPFSEFVEGETDTSETFYECLKMFCASHPFVLAFDTFENLDKVAGDWIFKGGPDGLQVPGLICIVAGRDQEIDDIEHYLNNPNVLKMPVSGFTLAEAEEFYQKIADEFNQDDLDLAKAAGLPKDSPIQTSVEWVRKVTDGHPLKLEMAFRWSGTLLDEGSLKNLTGLGFLERLMQEVREFAEMGRLDAGPDKKVSKPVYDTLLCMAYITRRFDEHFLQYLIEKGFIELGESDVSVREILETLEKYFFVKRRTDSKDDNEYFLQLHDEMAYLVRKYIWPYIDQSGEKKRDLLKAVIEYYDQSIQKASVNRPDIQNVLRIEQLFYMLQYDLFGDGKRMWFDLVALEDEYLNRLLPGEIKDYKKQFDDETRFEIHTSIAQMEFEANHLTQAKGEWTQVYDLGKGKDRPDWMASSLISKANCEKDLDTALQGFQDAVTFCEEKAPSFLPRVYNLIGFTYRRMHKIDEAITWYRKAQNAFQQNPSDMALGAQISNDLGYAYSLIGEWAECRENVKEGQESRQAIFTQLEQEINRLEKEIKAAPDGEMVGKLHDQLNRLQAKMARASLALGLSYSTLGEVYRYDGDLDDSLSYYGLALNLFEQVRNYTWQAKTLFSRGETFRRIARSRCWDSDDASYRAQMQKAQDDIQKSLYLCEKYQVKGERDTANRRMGRVLHDLALYEFEKGDKQNTKEIVQDYLEQARFYFEEGVKYAEETRDVLEILSNLSELAFIYDDFMDVAGTENVPGEYQEYLDKFKDALSGHREDRFRIHQFTVFENLYKMEKAATDYQNKDFDSALKGYLEAFVGLASDPGYGRTRFKQHFPHLKDRIEKMPVRMATEWCHAFLEAWEQNRVKGKERTLAQEVRRPDLVIWCRQHLSKIKA